MLLIHARGQDSLRPPPPKGPQKAPKRDLFQPLRQSQNHVPLILRFKTSIPSDHIFQDGTLMRVIKFIQIIDEGFGLDRTRVRIQKQRDIRIKQMDMSRE